ncbi:MAG: helix-turn-helix domain-containing protein [Micromonosporaceae bacterium]|nr:helix-turn-helix domain-containing protein [Micromonosporaceae bacterium]
MQSVDRAVTILEILARRGEVGVTELANEIGVHKSTAFRLAATLEARGLVEQNTERGKYRLGVGIVRLAGATAARLDVVQESRLVCRRLATETGETVNIVMLSDGAALYVDQVAGSSALQPHNWVGRRLPLHATSNGKVLLAFRREGESLSELLETPLKRFTDRTITTTRALKAELDTVRRQGYAAAVDEFEVGLTAVGAPVRNADGECVASLSASGPSFRLTAERVEEIAKAVVAAADEVSGRLGWPGQPRDLGN